ncbi:hypothetical protein PN465_20910, partial [Nodularia spumigena CS-584]|nr:hypothetical protein [Nodularia spumigena CS-584]
RNKIRSVFNKSTKKGNSAKADRIKRNNLGKIKWNNRETSFKGRIQTNVYSPMHRAIAPLNTQLLPRCPDS